VVFFRRYRASSERTVTVCISTTK